MATVPLVATKLARGVQIITWSPLTQANPDGDWFDTEGGPFFPDKTLHIYGTPGAGGTFVIEGSNGPAQESPVTLTDIHGGAASYTANSIDVLAENPRAIRPRLSAGGDGTTSMTVILVCHAIRPYK